MNTNCPFFFSAVFLLHQRHFSWWSVYLLWTCPVLSIGSSHRGEYWSSNENIGSVNLMHWLESFFYFQELKCECEANTCGNSCEMCCPLFNQQPWKPGTFTEAAICEGKSQYFNFQVHASLETLQCMHFLRMPVLWPCWCLWIQCNCGWTQIEHQHQRGVYWRRSLHWLQGLSIKYPLATFFHLLI